MTVVLEFIIPLYTARHSHFSSMIISHIRSFKNDFRYQQLVVNTIIIQGCETKI